MKQQSKLTSKQELSVEQQLLQSSGHEFKSSEELLRFDAAQVSVPPEIAGKLQKSSAELGPVTRPWWKNLFRK